MAAGLSLQESCLPAFERAFAEEIASRVDVSALTGVIFSDGALSAKEFDIETARALRSAGPGDRASLSRCSTASSRYSRRGSSAVNI